MAATLTTTPVSSSTNIGLLLLPQLRSTAHEDVADSARLLRVLLRGLATPGLAPARIRSWLLTVEPELGSIVSDPISWHRLVRLARQRIARENSAAGVEDLRFGIARLWVARSVTPLGAGAGAQKLTWAREVNARAAFSVIAKQQIELGFSKIVVTAGWLAVRLGVSRPYAAGILRTLEKDIHWIRRDGKRSGSIRWRLTRLEGPNGEELRARAYLFGGAIDALAAGKPENDYLATVLSSVDHPAWAYSTENRVPGLPAPARMLGLRAWVALVHEHGGLPPDEAGLGLRIRTLRKVKKELELDVPGALTGQLLGGGGTLVGDLNDVASTSGAFARRDLADDAFRAEAIKATARIQAFRIENDKRFAARKAAFRILKAGGSMGGAPGAIPSSGDRDELAAWTNAATGFWRGGAGSRLYATADASGLVEVLAEKIRERSYSVEDAAKAADFVFRG